MGGQIIVLMLAVAGAWFAVLVQHDIRRKS